MISFEKFDEVATYWRNFGSYFHVLLGYAQVRVLFRGTQATRV